MKTTILVSALAVTLGLLLSVPPAHAGQPLDVDCDVLEASLIHADGILEDAGVVFDSLGDLVSSAILDDDVFITLQSLILLCSGGTIDFDSASQSVATIARCGLMPLL